jgi:tetrahydromethanopterin S-methyltransferase subunit D
MATQERRYTTLLTIARVLRIVAWVVAILGGLGVIGGTLQTLSDESAGQAFAVLVVGILAVALYTLFFLAAAEGIKLAIDIEGNTRRTAEALTGVGRRPPPPGP